MLTALIVTQMSIGQSLKTSIDYLVGTVGGTIYGAALTLLIPHNTEATLVLVLVLAVAPVALVAALNRNLNAVPVSSIIVVLMPRSPKRARSIPRSTACSRSGVTPRETTEL